MMVYSWDGNLDPDKNLWSLRSSSGVTELDYDNATVGFQATFSNVFAERQTYPEQYNPQQIASNEYGFQAISQDDYFFSPFLDGITLGNANYQLEITVPAAPGLFTLYFADTPNAFQPWYINYVEVFAKQRICR
jgi:hypothetical protein